MNLARVAGAQAGRRRRGADGGRGGDGACGSFRGLLDTHVHDAGAARQWPSAVLVSALGGLWHLPVAVTDTALPVTVALMLAVHVPIGVPMSLAWRRTGNLMVPVIAHALIDAFRNALLIGL